MDDTYAAVLAAELADQAATDEELALRLALLDLADLLPAPAARAGRVTRGVPRQLPPAARRIA